MTVCETHPMKILVVDDSASVRMRIKQLLEDEKTTVVQAENGRQGVELFHSEGPDCILLDYVMPDMDGIDVLAELIADRDRPPVAGVMLTGSGSESVAVKAMKHGVHDYLVKGEMTPEILHRAIQDAIAKVNAEREHGERYEHMTQVSQQLAEANAELTQMACKDPLTNLFNRRAMDEYLTQEHERSLRYGHLYNVIMLDIDHFKLFNDAQGHPAGDDCLRQVARSIKQTVRVADVAGRYGGEEFIVLVPHTSLDGTQTLATRIRDAVYDLNIPHPASPTADRVTVSLGVAAGLAERWEDIVREADEALYRAKKTGRNRVCIQETQACLGGSS